MASGDLEARLVLLESEQAILKNLYRYGHSIDYGDEEAWVDCFTEDGVFDVRARLSHQPNRVISGRDELRAFIKRHTRAPELWHKHLLIEPLIEVDGDTATVRSYLAVVMEHEDEPIVRVFGRYRDRLVRCPDGRWRFRERIADVESMHTVSPLAIEKKKKKKKNETSSTARTVLRFAKQFAAHREMLCQPNNLERRAAPRRPGFGPARAVRRGFGLGKLGLGG